MKKDKRNIFQKVRDYILGNFVYHIYYSKYFTFLIPNYIFEQINMRILSMNSICFNTGSCVHCGCSTTALQMVKQKCGGECYPDFMGRAEWDKFLKTNKYTDGKLYWIIENGMIINTDKEIYDNQ